MLEAELMYILEALSWTKEFQGQPINIECDSLLAISAIQKKLSNHSKLGYIIDQCNEILGSRDDLSIGFVKKHAKTVDHKLARIPCALDCFIISLSRSFYIFGVGDPIVGLLEQLMKVCLSLKKSTKYNENCVIKEGSNSCFFLLSKKIMLLLVLQR